MTTVRAIHLLSLSRTKCMITLAGRHWPQWASTISTRPPHHFVVCRQRHHFDLLSMTKPVQRRKQRLPGIHRERIGEREKGQSPVVLQQDQDLIVRHILGR